LLAIKDLHTYFKKLTLLALNTEFQGS